MSSVKAKRRPVRFASMILCTLSAGLILMAAALYYSGRKAEHNLIMVAASCAILPINIVYLCCQKYFTKGSPRRHEEVKQMEAQSSWDVTTWRWTDGVYPRRMRPKRRFA